MSRELDSIIERQLSVLEHTLPSANSRFLFTLGMHGKFSLASAALAFHGLRETTSEKGRVFADRAEMLVAKMKANYPQVNFAGVTDFYLRQAKVTFEGELAEIREMTEMMDLDGKEEERDARTKKAVTIEEQLEIVKVCGDGGVLTGFVALLSRNPL
ncbi:MAG: hypothetical protein L6R37_000141 [Teloschistes peruensis]|nr:MAG: hypothetical protein L6R37_000141 [Teloschistes peruensis]